MNFSKGNVNELVKADAVQFKQELINSDIAMTTVNKILGRLYAFYEYVHNNFDLPNIFEGLKVKRASKQTVKNERQALTNSEAKDLITFANNQNQTYKWPILIGLFTGMRLNEICQLKKKDIVHESGIWCIKVQEGDGQRLKTKSANRLIPIHNYMINNGFIDFVHNDSNTDWLFPDFIGSSNGYASQIFSLWFTRYKPTVIKHHVFHSLRHTVASKLRESDISINITALILGHNTNHISHDLYAKHAKTNLQILKKAIDGVTYE